MASESQLILHPTVQICSTNNRCQKYNQCLECYREILSKNLFQNFNFHSTFQNRNKKSTQLSQPFLSPESSLSEICDLRKLSGWEGSFIFPSCTGMNIDDIFKIRYYKGIGADNTGNITVENPSVSFKSHSQPDSTYIVDMSDFTSFYNFNIGFHIPYNVIS